MTSTETVLPGGQINQVVRIGDTVRRSVTADRSQQHALLRHLEAVGFDGAPRLLGLDEQGREILTFLPSDLAADASGFSDTQLIAAARLLRRYHDATTTLAAVVASGAEVMCHNDWTPANTLFRAGMPYALIDFDTARTGTRLWDLTYSVWTWLDLSDPAYSGPEQIRRIALFCEAYEHPSCTLAHVAGYLPTRQAGVAQWARANDRAAGAEWALNCLDWTLTHITDAIHPNGRP